MVNIHMMDDANLPPFEVGDRCLVVQPVNRGRVTELIAAEIKRCRVLGLSVREQTRCISERLLALCWRGRMRARTDDRILLEGLRGEGEVIEPDAQWFEMSDVFAVLKRGQGDAQA